MALIAIMVLSVPALLIYGIIETVLNEQED